MPYLQPLAWELLHSPRCGLCAFFPINYRGKYPCPIGQKYVHRRNRPPSKPGKHLGGHNYRCFLAMSEYAYEIYRAYWKNREDQANIDYQVRQKQYHKSRPTLTPEEIKKRGRDQQRERRRLNPQPHRDEVKRWRELNPEKADALVQRYREKHRGERKETMHQFYLEHKEEIKERAWFRNIIVGYDPMEPIRRAFSHAKRVERQGPRKRTEKDKARRRELAREAYARKKGLVRIDVIISSSLKSLSESTTEPTTELNVEKLRTPKKPRSKNRELWMTHPDKYREQQAKFKRLDMQ